MKLVSSTFNLFIILYQVCFCTPHPDIEQGGYFLLLRFIFVLVTFPKFKTLEKFEFSQVFLVMHNLG